MEARILELLHRPENITKEDIVLLQKEIFKYPYMQSIRTLQLSAIHLFDAENYQKELTKTAAFTTDKKILYQFINKKKIEERKEAVKLKKINFKSEEPQTVVSEPVFIVKDDEILNSNQEKLIPDTEVEVSLNEKADFSKEVERVNVSENIEIPKDEIEQIIAEKPVVSHPNSLVGDTELETPIIDKKENEFEVIRELETLEEVLPFEIEEESIENLIFKTRKEDLDFSKETVLEQFDQISDTEKISVKPSEISFNAFDSFLPDVKFTVPVAKLEPLTMPEVLKKEEPIISSDEKQNEVLIEEKTEIIDEEPLLVVEEKSEENLIIPAINEVIFADVVAFEEPKQTEIIEEPEETHFEWKPMSFVQNPLDSQIKKQNTEAPKTVAPVIINEPEIIVNEVPSSIEEEITHEIEELIQDSENIEPVEEIPTAEIDDERPVINVSFFSKEVAEVPPKTEEKTEKTTQENPEEEILEHSNIPNFVNTWQSWLKIDRTEQPEEVAPPEKVIEKKAEIIDKFIEENPKISQLKEEVNFVVKEKTDDISHLMTETLAKLYVEQRLYTKAIKAYEVLQNKNPEKVEYFKAKIQEIKELRQGK
jgi:hypothetical protein